MATIKFKRGTTLNFPTGLTLAEPAFDYLRNRLFVGITGSAVWIGAGITTGDVGVGSTLIIPTQSAVQTYVVAGISQSVTSINGATGAIGVCGSSSISVVTSGRTLTIDYIGLTGNVFSVNGSTGIVGITGDGTSIRVSVSGRTSTISYIGLTGNVFSVNGSTGIVGVTGDGTSIGVSVSGRTSTISYIGLTGNVFSVDGVTGAVDIVAGSNTSVIVSGKTITIGYSGPTGNVFSVNGFTGNITLSAGTNISISPQLSGDILISSTASGAAGTKTLAVFSVLDSNPPATNFATIDTRNSVPVLEFDAATVESTFFSGIIPQGTILGSTLGAFLHFAGDTAVGATVAWGICMERMTGTFGFSADSFGTGVQINQILPATTAAITIAGAAAVPVPTGLTQGEAYRLLIRRIATDATNDTAAGDAQLVMVELRNT